MGTMKALFDFSFNSFIAPSIAKIVYLLVLVVIVISYLLFVVISFEQSSVLGFLVLLIIGPLFGLLYLVLARVGLESLIATIRTAENTGELVRRAGNAGPGSMNSPSYPTTGPGSSL
jgi:hypothetical protein